MKQACALKNNFVYLLIHKCNCSVSENGLTIKCKYSFSLYCKVQTTFSSKKPAKENYT